MVAPDPSEPKPVAAIVSAFTPDSTADVLLGRILEAGPRSGLQIVALHTHQVPSNDWSRVIARKHQLNTYDSVQEAITQGTGELAVDGVICIPEGGRYATDPWGLPQSPGRQFFAEITGTMERSARIAPVYMSSYLSNTWKDAEWVFRRAQNMMLPVIGGSPYAYAPCMPHMVSRCEMDEVVAIAPGSLKHKHRAFNALELVQSVVERRIGVERGVCAVQYYPPGTVWSGVRRRLGLRGMIDRSLACRPGPRMRASEFCRDVTEAIRIDYIGNPTAWILLSPTVNTYAVSVRDGLRKHTYRFNNTNQSAYDNLVRAITQTFVQMHTTHEFARNLLTTGLLQAALQSQVEKKTVPTPNLHFTYHPLQSRLVHSQRS